MKRISVLFENVRLPRLSTTIETRIRAFDPDEVTSLEGGQPECDPVDAGLTQRDYWDTSGAAMAPTRLQRATR